MTFHKMLWHRVLNATIGPRPEWVARGGKWGRDNNLSGRDEVQILCKVRVKKIEKEVIRFIAIEEFGPCRSRKPAIGKALVYLLRVALNCFREHTDKYQNPTPITQKRAIAEGLRTPYRSNKVRLSSRRHSKRDSSGRFS